VVRRNDTDVETMVAAVNLISKKWHPIIIQSLLRDGPLRFSELKQRLDISAKVLTDSLDDLVENDLVNRVEVSESPRRVEYDLTRHGRDMQSVIDALADWGEEHLGEDTRPVVLVVDNDPRLVTMHASWLEEEYQIERAYDGEEALRKLTDEIDVVLLDRRMPGLSGEEVLERIRDLRLGCQVIMLSAVEPDFDILEMGFDAYIVKPGTKEELKEVIADVLARNAYDSEVQEYLALSAKRAVLQAEKTEGALQRDDRYRRVEARLRELEASVDTADEESAVSDVKALLNNS
jgi:DNA-binding HxlR family transcriptional regulator/DNA-binding response OmpR family regulator